MAADDRRAQLIAAAIEVMTTEGIEAVSTRRVAQEAGVSVGVVHYCFGTKENLLRRVIEQLVDDIRRSAQARITPGQDLTASLSKATEAFMGDVEERPDRHLLTYEIVTYALRTEGSEDLAVWLYECYQSATVDTLEAAAVAAGVRWTVPVEVVARILTAANDGVTLEWLVRRDGTQARTTFAHVIDAVLPLATSLADDATSTGRNVAGRVHP
ncbi:TetR/AcrR family transcriptional regulator [Microbacterium sp. SORGH_AS_0862]|uniref:TetR/AcrR family transcriptional regulator n=1 Tax=Microbacterium sp. SORGH_AS_0862 TaxID=3041789 RepID=UPI0027D902E0|nr:TetR/AcrR family transcriptional regulator [Microbacterium sp. SORGH_AS_0862]